MDMKTNRYCAVFGCESCSDRVKLYKFPRGQAFSSMWKEVLAKHCPSLQINRRCHQIWVCRRHFEAKYILPNGRRHYCSIPTLFTDSEITSGVPTNPITLGRKAPTSGTKASLTSDKEIIAHDHSYFACCWINGQANSDVQTIKERPDVPAPEEINQYTFGINIKALGIDDDEENDCDSYENYLEINEETTETSCHFHNVDKQASGFNKQQIDENPDDAANFTWNQLDAVIPVADLEEDTQLLSLYCESEKQITAVKDREVEEDFKCNNCSARIDGVRYTCVECADYDLCPPCDARGVHDAHYVLRVPRDKPHWEVRRVVLGVRRRLQRANCDQPPLCIKEEESDDEVGDSPAESMRLSPELDPLLCPPPPRETDPLLSPPPPRETDPLLSPHPPHHAGDPLAHSDTHLRHANDLYFVVDHRSIEDCHDEARMPEPPTPHSYHQHKDSCKNDQQLGIERRIEKNINTKIVIPKNTREKTQRQMNSVQKRTKYLVAEMDDEVMYSSDERCEDYVASHNTIRRDLDHEVEQKRRKFEANIEQSFLVLNVSPKLQPRVVLNPIDHRLYNELLRTGKVRCSAKNGMDFLKAIIQLENAVFEKGAKDHSQFAQEPKKYLQDLKQDVMLQYLLLTQCDLTIISSKSSHGCKNIALAIIITTAHFGWIFCFPSFMLYYRM